MHNKSCFGKDNNKQINKTKGDIMFKTNMGLIMGAVGGMVMLGVGVAMLSNTRAARRRRMMRRAMKTVRNVGCAMQKLGSF